MSNKIDYERHDYGNLAKEFGCKFRVGKYGIKFLAKDFNGKVYKLVQVIPLDGWISNPKEVERIMRERGMEL